MTTAATVQDIAGERTQFIRATCDQTGEEKEFGALHEVKEWACLMTMTFQQDLTFTVVTVVETSAQIHASYATGEVEQCL